MQSVTAVSLTQSVLGIICNKHLFVKQRLHIQEIYKYKAKVKVTLSPYFSKIAGKSAEKSSILNAHMQCLH